MAHEKPTLPIPVADPDTKPQGQRKARGPFAAFAAQILGEGVRKRGLKGGRPVIEAARSTYLETEWSGPNDRRLAKGRIARKDV